MMLLAGASRTVVAASWPTGLAWSAALGAEAIGLDAEAASPLAGPAAFAAELAAPLEVPAEHPARNKPPPSRTLPIMRPATTPCLVFPGVFRMPL
jgi:hypothetical protein